MARPQRNAAALTRGEAVIEFCETYLRVPEGAKVGRFVELQSWQRDIIRGIYDGNARRAIVSFPRKSGKTSLTAMLLLAHLAGPMARKNSSIYSAAQSREQAAIVFALAAKMVRMSPDLNELVTVREARKELFCGLTGVTYQALSADASTAYGLSPVLVIHDELGQVRGPRSELYEALETATAAQESPLSVVISTQAPNDSDLLSILIDDAKAGGDPRTQLYLWTAPEDADPFSLDTIKACNPAFGVFQNADEVLAMADAAKRMPSREAAYRNLVLNQRIEVHNPIVTKAVWDACADPADAFGSGPVYGGLDLSQTTDLTALVLVSPVNGVLHVRPTFWLPLDGLTERSRTDRVTYDLWHERGLLNCTSGAAVEYEYVAEHIARLFQEMDLRKVAFDRWNMRHLRPWLVKAGLSEAFIDERFVDFGQGFVSMSPAIRTLEEMLVNRRVRHGNHPILTMCMSNAVAKMDEAGNRKMDKKRSTGRIDGAVALAMAAATAAEDMRENSVFPVHIDAILEDLHAA